MELYNAMHVITNILFTYSIYQFFHAFTVEIKYDKKYEYLSYILFFVVSSSLVYITRLPIVNFLFVIISLFLLSYNYDIKIQKKVILSVSICVILFIIELLLAVSLGFLEVSAFKNDAYYSVSALVLIRVVSLIVACLINRYNKAISKNFTIPFFYYLAIVIVLVGSLYLFVLTLERDDINIYSVYLSCFVLAMINVTMVLLDEKIYTFLIILHEKNMIEQQNIAYEHQIHIINQSNESIRIVKHDMKNHLNMLNEMYDSGNKSEIKSYISNIMNEFEKGQYSNSNNFVIDSILNFKLGSIKDKDVNLSIEVNVPQTLNILAADLTSILANLLDNAMDALVETEEKYLDITVMYRMHNLVILIDNTFNGKLICEKGIFITTKSNKSAHGLGIVSVKKIVEKYDGEVKITYTENKFSVSIIMPCI